MTKDLIIRRADLADMEWLVKLRLDFLAEEFGDVTDQEMLISDLVPYFTRRFLDHSFVAIVAEAGGTLVGGAFLVIADAPPGPSFPNGRIGNVLNVLVYPPYRSRGAGRRIMDQLIAAARQEHVSTLRLAATDKGRALYQKLGFDVQKYPAMSLSLVEFEQI